MPVKAIDDDRSVVCLNAPRAHSVAHVAIHSLVVSQGTGVVDVQNADIVMY
jgi:hypothetical protein